jgi:hypothetical protein
MLDVTRMDVKFNKNCYLTFAAIDAEDGNKITQSTFSYFNIDKASVCYKKTFTNLTS